MKEIDKLKEQFENIQLGQWIFTRDGKPTQFASWGPPTKDPTKYNRSAFTDKEWEDFAKYDNFTTIDGKKRSIERDGCRPVSEEYAKWFIKNKCWELWVPNVTSWADYGKKLEVLAKQHGIAYEGFNKKY